jgi:hypothetical protein
MTTSGRRSIRAAVKTRVGRLAGPSLIVRARSLLPARREPGGDAEPIGNRVHDPRYPLLTTIAVETPR